MKRTTGLRKLKYEACLRVQIQVELKRQIASTVGAANRRIEPAEAERVFRHYDGLNGRYYFKADIVLEDGRLLADVTFDGDSAVAVEYQRRFVYEQPDLLNKQAETWLVTIDRSCGRLFGDASEEQRRHFFAQYHRLA
jgi:hypothetical protein